MPRRTVRANPATFTPEMPFGEAIQILRNSTRPPLNIIVLWKEIGDNAGIICGGVAYCRGLQNPGGGADASIRRQVFYDRA